jgi:L-fuconolactonase
MIDAHFHAWRLARGDYGWLTPQLGVIHRDVEVAHWRALAAPLGVRGGVLVQAAPTAAETEFLLALAAPEPDVLAVVGWTDLAAGDAANQVAALARHEKLKGLRPMLQDIADPDWILRPELAPALAAMASEGLVFDALVRSVHLPRVRELARRHPGLRIVIDHGAKPDIARGEWQPWAGEMERIAAETGAFCKLSGLLTEAGARAAQPQAVLPWMQHLLRVFGPQRLLWGSDWPVLELAGGYAQWFQMCRELAGDLKASEREAVFGGNARQVYRLGVS